MERKNLTIVCCYEAPRCALLEVKVELGFTSSTSIDDWEEDEDSLN